MGEGMARKEKDIIGEEGKEKASDFSDSPVHTCG